MKKSASDRFWVKVKELPSGCWAWTAARTADGYGNFKASTGVTVRAHRWAYETMVGELPVGLDLDHLCHNKTCVNFQHLEPVTRGVNTLRGQRHHGVKAGAEACPNGHSYSETNTRMTKRGRICRTCVALSSRAYRGRARAMS